MIIQHIDFGDIGRSLGTSKIDPVGSCQAGKNNNYRKKDFQTPYIICPRF